MPTITVATIAGDAVTASSNGTIDPTEWANAQLATPTLPTITGSCTSADGQTVTVTINGKNYTTTVATGGAWSITLPKADVLALNNGNTYKIVASVTNAAGNTASDNDNALDALLTTPDVPTVFNLRTSSTTPTVSGLARHADGSSLVDGDTITIVLKGVTTTATVSSSATGTNTTGVSYNKTTKTWSLDTSKISFGLTSPSTNSLAVTTVINGVSKTDISSNELLINSTAPTIALNTVSMDNIINNAEHNQALWVTGTTNAEVGSTVTLTGLDGTTRSAVVIAGTTNNTFSFSVAQADVSAFTSSITSFTAQATVTNSFGVSASANKVVTVDITAPNINSAASVAQNENIAAATVVYTATTTDVSGISYRLSGTDATKFDIDSATGKVTIKASPNFEAKSSYSFNVIATDLAGNTSTKAVTLTINNLDEVAPIFTSGMTAKINENVTANTQVVYTAVAVDTDFIAPNTSSSATFSLKSTGDAASFSINSTTGAVTFKDSGNYEVKKIYTFTVIATDAGGNTVEKTVTMRVADLNEAPTGVADTATAKEAGGLANATAGTTPSGNVLTNDSDVDALNVISVKDIKAGTTGTVTTVSSNGTKVVGSFGTLTISTNGSYTYSVNNTNAAVQALNTTSTALVDSFTYSVKDRAGLSTTATLNVSVTGANDAPIVSTAIGRTTATEGIAYSLQANGISDVDNSTLTYTAGLSSGAALPSWLTFNATTRTFSGTPTLGAAGSYSIKVTASDGSLSVSDTFVISVATGNRAPVLTDKVLTLANVNTSNVYIAPVGAVGSLVSTLVTGVTDTNTSNAKGIAITTVDTTKGTLWFSTNGGTTWSTVGAVSSTSALLLGADTDNRLYYQPISNTIPSTIASAFTLRAWDGTSGTEGTKVDTTVTGGMSAFSTATDTVAVTIATAAVAPISLNSTSLVINGETSSNYSGYSVSNAGDVNGDGYDDLIVGAYSADPTSRTDAGKSYVVFGSANNAAINLSAVAAGTGGFVINGAATSDQSGYSVSNLGDMNGDGLADLLVGARYGSSTNVGYAYVVYGKTNTTAIDLTAVAAGTGGFVIKGTSANDYAGTSVSSAGDVNGDGIVDLIVGAPYAQVSASFPDAGRTYVVFGKANNTAVDLSTVASGTGGFVINGVATSDYTGTSVSSAGDVNGDGLADVIVGGYGSGAAGLAYVVFGKTTTAAVTLPSATATTFAGGFAIKGVSSNDDAGYAVSNAGDVNGDGLADLLVGARNADLTSASLNSGKAYVVFGKSNTTTVNLSTVALGTGGYVLNGPTANAQAGLSLSYAGDINGDGLADTIIGAPNASSYSGKTYVAYGKNTTTAISLSNIEKGIGGFVVNGYSSYDYSGTSVTYAGDINGDGFDDLAVGVYGANVGSVSDAGKSYILFGGKQLGAIVDYVGTTAADTQTGTTASEYFAAGDGNDTLIGNGGADVMMGGKGNDIFVLNATNVTSLQSKFGLGGNTTLLSTIDGGTGLDMIQLAGGANLDLTLVSNVGGATPDGTSRITSIERIDLATDTAANTVKLALKDVIDMAGDNLFNSTNTTAVSGTGIGASVAKHQVMITGTALDTANITLASWTISNTIVAFEGHNYVVYNANSSVAAQLLIDQAIVNTSGHVL